MDENGTILESNKSVCVKVYLNRKLFTEVAQQAEKAGKRRPGLLLFTKKKNGFAGEMLANTDGISRFFKYCAAYYKEHEAERLAKAADLAERERDLAAEKKRLGIS